MKWKKVTLVGVGLLGGSLGLALKERKLAAYVVGYVRRQASVDECLARGAVDEATTDLIKAVTGADLIVLCTPIAQMRDLVKAMLPAVRRGAVITDVGSVKRVVVRQIEPLAKRAGANFVGSHPMAGSEKTGVTAADAGLFEQAACVVTPTKATSATALKRIKDLWRSVGCRVVQLEADLHDRLVGNSSHLPHVLAAHLSNFVLGTGNSDQALLCANGFRDTTRIASGSPEMWRDIVIANALFISQSLRRFTSRLESFQELIRSGDEDRILAFFKEAKQNRDSWVTDARTKSPE